MLIFYEAPHRVKTTLADIFDALGDRQCVIARELTKLHEEFLRGAISEIIKHVEENAPRGEFVLLIGPPLGDNQSRPVPRSITQEVEELMRDEGLDRKSALKRVARSLGLSRSEAYRRMVAERSETGRDE